MSTLPAPPRPASDFSPQNLAPTLLGTDWTLTLLAAVFLALRLYCKLSIAGHIWWDDAILTASFITLLASTSLTTHLTTLGLGLPTILFPIQNLPGFLLPAAIRGTFIITSLAWSKTAFGITLLRLTTGWLRKCVWVIIITVNLSLGLSAFLPWVQCKPVEAFWRMDVQGECWPQERMYGYNVFSGAYSGVMDFVLAVLPWRVVMGLQMRTRERVGVGVAMSMGVLAGVAAFVKTGMLKGLYGGELYDTVPLFIWDTVEASITIIAASIPVLRVLIRDVRTRSKATPHAVGTGTYELSSNRRMRTGSEKSMLDVTVVEHGAIMRTDTVSVRYGQQNPGDVESDRPFGHL